MIFIKSRILQLVVPADTNPPGARARDVQTGSCPSDTKKGDFGFTKVIELPRKMKKIPFLLSSNIESTRPLQLGIRGKLGKLDFSRKKVVQCLV